MGVTGSYNEHSWWRETAKKRPSILQFSLAPISAFPQTKQLSVYVANLIERTVISFVWNFQTQLFKHIFVVTATCHSPSIYPQGLHSTQRWNVNHWISFPTNGYFPQKCYNYTYPATRMSEMKAIIRTHQRTELFFTSWPGYNAHGNAWPPSH